MKSMWRCEEKIEDLITTFVASAAQYRLTCENLLGPLTLSDKEYTELLDNPNGESWQEERLAEQIRQRLGPSYRQYWKLVERLQKKLLKFATKIGLDPQNDMKASILMVLCKYIR